jgi:hypothetical protein
MNFILTETVSNAEAFQLDRQSARVASVFCTRDSYAQVFIKMGARMSAVYSTSLGSGRIVCGGRAVGGARTSNLLGSRSSRCSIRIWYTKVKAQATNVDIAMAPEEESAKDGLGEEVQNTVEDSFGVRRDNVPAFAHAPSDRVQEPETNSPKTANSVNPVDIGTEITSMATSIENDGPSDEEEGNNTEDEVTPLIRAFDQGTNQTSDNHDLIDQDSIQNGWPRKPGGQQKVEEQQWPCEEPYE